MVPICPHRKADQLPTRRVLVDVAFSCVDPYDGFTWKSGDRQPVAPAPNAEACRLQEVFKNRFCGCCLRIQLVGASCGCKQSQLKAGHLTLQSQSQKQAGDPCRIARLRASATNVRKGHFGAGEQRAFFRTVGIYSRQGKMKRPVLGVIDGIAQLR